MTRIRAHGFEYARSIRSIRSMHGAAALLAITCCALGPSACVLNTDTVDSTIEARAADSKPSWRELEIAMCIGAEQLLDGRCPRATALSVRGRSGTSATAALHVRGYETSGDEPLRERVNVSMRVPTPGSFEASSGNPGPVLLVEPFGYDERPFGDTLFVDALHVEMPRERNLSAFWTAGSIDVRDIDGDLSLHTERADGRIAVGGKATIVLMEGTGGLEIEAGAVQLEAPSGLVRVATEGLATISGDDLQIELAAQSANVTGGSQGVKGDVRGEAEIAARGPVALRVGGGGRITTVGGAAIEVVVTGTEFEALAIESDTGAVRLRLPAGADFTLDAASQAGVRVNVGTVHARGASYAGDLLAKGPPINIRSKGAIEVLEEP